MAKTVKLHTRKKTPLVVGSPDPLPEIIEITRSAIADGLIDEPHEAFEYNIKVLNGSYLEDYIQTVWDKI